jgi:membrane associated rhomboid family serine protease
MLLLIYRPLFLLVCLPAFLAFCYYKNRFAAEPLLLRVESSAAASSWTTRTVAGIYLLDRRHQESPTTTSTNNASNGARLYAKPRDLFYPVEGMSPIFISESSAAGEPSCLHQQSSPSIAPICNKGPTLDGDYYDSQGQLLISVTKIQRQSTMADPSNKNWIVVTQQMPATCLLIGLNVVLFYVYWDRAVDPLSVAKIYDSMVQYPFEIWRTFTGATAHFEPWHLGLNMLSFSALGRDLEPRISAPVFLLDNISLMPLVATVWMMFNWFGARYLNQQRAATTVGYSGVLFAWLTVASLEQSKTCPIVFFPSLCFQTYQMGGLKFSLGPLVQLVVMQVLLPRASFYGHLAGILVGFLMHWGLLPARLVQPSVLIPCLYCLYLHLLRKVDLRNALSIRNSLCRPDEVCLAFQVALLCLSAFVLRMDSVLDLGMTVFYWVVARLMIDRDSNVRQVLIKATVVSAVIVMASDAIKLGFYFAFQGFSTPSTVTFLVRTIGLFWMLILSGVTELEADDGIFERTLSFVVLDFCRAIKRPVIPSRILLPTSDEGRRLGGSTSAGTGERPLSRLLEMA